MSFLQRILAAAVLVLATSGGAQAAQRHMPLGAATAAPDGYIAFCQRDPAACGADAAQVRAAAHANQAVWTANLWAARPAPPPAAPDLAASPLPALGPGLWATLVKTNARVNAAIRPQADLLANGAADYWSTPLRDGRAVGDCEDYVLEKRRALIAAGVPAGALSIAVATTGEGLDHAVLLVSTRSGDFVLDNLRAGIARWDELPYVWRARQAGGAAFHWVSVAG